MTTQPPDKAQPAKTDRPTKLTIEELEAVLNSEEDIPVVILPNGECSWPLNVSRKIKRCKGCGKNFLEEVKFFDGTCDPRCKAPSLELGPYHPAMDRLSVKFGPDHHQVKFSSPEMVGAECILMNMGFAQGLSSQQALLKGGLDRGILQSAKDLLSAIAWEAEHENFVPSIRIQEQCKQLQEAIESGALDLGGKP